MSLRIFLLFCIFLLSSSAHAQLRNDSFNALPDSNSANFRTQSRTFWQYEDASREGEIVSPSVVSGGVHTTSASLTSVAFATIAHVPERVSQTAAAITYIAIAGDTCWAIVSSNTNGIAGWTRQPGTAYYSRCGATGAPPLLPANSAWLMRVLVSGSPPGLTAVLDLTRPTRAMVTEAALASYYGVTCDGGTTDNSIPLTNALAAVKRWGGKLILPGSPHTCNFSTGIVIVQSWLIMEGQGSGWSDNITGAAPTRLKYTGTGNAITIGDGTTPVTNVKFRDFELIGSGASGHGIYLRGDTANNYVLRSKFENLYIHGFTATDKAGFFHEGGIENVLEDVYLYGNYLGLKSDSILNGATPTTFLCSQCLVRQSTANGVQITGTTTFSHIVFNNMSIFESNGNSGMYVPSTNTGYIYGLEVRDSYFENNNTTGGSYQFETRGTNTQYVRNVELNNVVFVNPAGPGGDINFEGTINSLVRNIRGGAPAGKAIYHQESNSSAIQAEGIETATGGAVDAEGRLAFFLPHDANGIPRTLGGYREFGRTTPLGVFVNFPYNAVNFNGLGGQTWTLPLGGTNQPTYRYTIIGKMMTVLFYIQNSTVGGVANSTLTLSLPTGFIVNSAVGGSYDLSNNGGTPVKSSWNVVAGGTVINLLRDVTDTTTWTGSASNNTMEGQASFEVQ